MSRRRSLSLFHTFGFALLSGAIVFGLDAGLNTLTDERVGDGLATAYFMAYAFSCARTYARCRDPYCAIAGPGSLVASGVMILRVTGNLDHGLWMIFAMFGVFVLLAHWVEGRSIRAEEASHPAGTL